MQLTQDSFEGEFLIQSYDENKIKINNEFYQHNLIVSKHKLITDWPAKSITELTTKDLQVIINLQPQIVLLGTGIKQKFPPAETLAFFYQQKIGVEIMTTGAACRTFTILMSEGRNVVAALFL